MIDRTEKPVKDTSEALWDYYYLIRVPQLQVTSVDYMRVFGTPMTGDKNIDKELSGQWMTTMSPIHKMIDFYKEGVQIKVVHYDDIKKIYDAISEHLAAWKTRLQYGINIGNAPIDDLIAMDEFANVIYAHAKYQFTAETVRSILANNLSNVTKVNQANFFKSPPPKKAAAEEGVIRINGDGPQTVQHPKPDEQPERESMSGFLQSRISHLKRW